MGEEIRFGLLVASDGSDTNGGGHDGGDATSGTELNKRKRELAAGTQGGNVSECFGGSFCC